MNEWMNEIMNRLKPNLLMCRYCVDGSSANDYEWQGRQTFDSSNNNYSAMFLFNFVKLGNIVVVTIRHQCKQIKRTDEPTQISPWRTNPREQTHVDRVTSHATLTSWPWTDVWPWHVTSSHGTRALCANDAASTSVHSTSGHSEQLGELTELSEMDPVGTCRCIISQQVWKQNTGNYRCVNCVTFCPMTPNQCVGLPSTSQFCSFFAQVQVT